MFTFGNPRALAVLLVALAGSAFADSHEPVAACDSSDVVREAYQRGCEAACAQRYPRGPQRQAPIQHENLRFPFHFTSTYAIHARPEEVVNANSEPSLGQEGGEGFFHYGINSHLDTICFNITIVNVRAPFASPAKTATHIHEGARGRAGPPRIAFPNPVEIPGRPDVLQSLGCLTGPFTTGIAPEGRDTGEGFKVSRIEENPSGFFTDVHTEARPDGAVRGQLEASSGFGPDFPFEFSSTHLVHALPDNVVNAESVRSFGQEGGQGWFNYGIHAALDIICFNITIVNVPAPFASPARTATHIHEGARDRAGPPRIAFPNPVEVHGRPDTLISVGCLIGPFTTGIAPEGRDTGENFRVEQIAANPAGFFTDVHTEARPDGAVRGQLA